MDTMSNSAYGESTEPLPEVGIKHFVLELVNTDPRVQYSTKHA